MCTLSRARNERQQGAVGSLPGGRKWTPHAVRADVHHAWPRPRGASRRERPGARGIRPPHQRGHQGSSMKIEWSKWTTYGIAAATVALGWAWAILSQAGTP